MNRIHGGDIGSKVREYGLSINEIVDFSANLNPLGPPAGLNEFITEHLPLLSCYPDQDSIELRETIGDHLNLPSQRIIIGNGSVELIYLVSRLLQRGNTLIPAPTFSEYEFAAMACGTDLKFLPLEEGNGFRPSIEDLVVNLQGTESLLLCNPNNPTGVLLETEDLLRLLESARAKGIFVVVDEAFIDFDPLASTSTLIRETANFENLFVIRSMTKLFAIPGLRLGYGVGSEPFIERLDRLRPPWNVNSLAQMVGQQLLNKRDFIDQTREFIKIERDLLLSELHKIDGLLVYPSSANFLLIRLLTSITSGELTQRLGRRGILVRDCSSFRFLGDRFIRVGVRKREENIRLISAIKEELNKYERLGE